MCGEVRALKQENAELRERLRLLADCGDVRGASSAPVVRVANTP